MDSAIHYIYLRQLDGDIRLWQNKLSQLQTATQSDKLSPFTEVPRPNGIATLLNLTASIIAAINYGDVKLCNFSCNFYDRNVF